MAREGTEHALRSSNEFIERSWLETIVPHTSHFNVEEALSNVDCSETHPASLALSSIEQRRLLFFDETVPVYVLLRTPPLGQDNVQALISRLIINVEAYAIGTSPHQPAEGQDTSNKHPIQAKELLFSDTVDDAEDPFIAVHGTQTEESTNAFVSVVWRVGVLLSRPRIRLQAPMIVFTASASLQPPNQIEPKVEAEEHMDSLVPAGINLLEAFKNDPSLSHANPRLSSLRISRVTPKYPMLKSLFRPLRSQAQRRFQIISAISTRIRHIKSQDLHQDSIIAALDFSVNPAADCDVCLNEVELKLFGGLTKTLTGPAEAGGLPMIFKPRDDVTFLYRLIPHEIVDQLAAQQAATPILKVLETSVSARVLASVECYPQVRMKWRTNVEFMAGSPSNSNLISIQSMRNTQNTLIQRPESPLTKPDLLPSMLSPVQPHTQELETGFGVTITISGPDRVQAGESFTWDVFIVNRSAKPRKLALLVLPRRRRLDLKKAPLRPSSSGNNKDNRAIVEAVIDENFIYAMQKGHLLESADLISLNTDIRVGPLAPDACHIATLRFLPISTGILRIEAIRLIDLATQDVVDIRDLPIIESWSTVS